MSRPSTLIKIKSYWCENTPTVEEITWAFDNATENTCIQLKWYVKHSGEYSRTIYHDYTNTMTPQEFYDNYIPKVYPT